jgi:hypothetical protein
MAHLVVDSNHLQSPQLRRFFAKAPANHAVLTDYVAMEAHQGNTLANITRRMAIVGEFPRQVLVLKNTTIVCGLRGRASGLQRRLIDDRQTRDFALYIRRLRDARAGNLSFQRQLLERGEAATQHLHRMQEDAQTLAGILRDVTQAFTKDERRLVRFDAPYTPEMIDKLVKVVIHISAHLFKGHPNVGFRPTYEELPNTFIFRASLCMFLLSLHWVAMGGFENASTTTMRNDMVDMNIVAYATYFDGLLSSDTKACRIHLDARLLLMALFKCPLPSGPGVPMPP